MKKRKTWKGREIACGVLFEDKCPQSWKRKLGEETKQIKRNKQQTFQVCETVTRSVMWSVILSVLVLVFESSCRSWGLSGSHGLGLNPDHRVGHGIILGVGLLISHGVNYKVCHAIGLHRATRENHRWSIDDDYDDHHHHHDHALAWSPAEGTDITRFLVDRLLGNAFLSHSSDKWKKDSINSCEVINQ